MAIKDSLLLVLPFLYGASADWTTTVHTTLVVPNTVTPVVDFVTPPPAISTPSSSTRTPLPFTFDHEKSHKLKLTSVVTVPNGQIPTIHFSLITSSTNTRAVDPSVTSSTQPAGAGGGSETEGSSDTTYSGPTPALTDSTGPNAPGSSPASYTISKPLIPGGTTTRGSAGRTSSSGLTIPDSTGSNAASSPPNGRTSSKPLIPHGSTTSDSPNRPISTKPDGVGSAASGSAASSSTHPGPSGGSTTSDSSNESSSSRPNGPDSTGSNASSSKPLIPSGSTPSGSVAGTSSSTPEISASNSASTTSTPLLDDTSTTDGTSSSRQKTTSGQTPSSGDPDSTTTGRPSSIPFVNPSDQVSSVDLASESAITEATGSDSAIAVFAPTASPSREEWATIPTTTETGSAATTSSDTPIAILLSNPYNNIDDLKKDSKKYKDHIKEIDDKTSEYLSKTNFDTSKTPCSSSKKRSLAKRGLFDAVANIAKEAVDATVDTAEDIANSALSCVAPIIHDIKDVIPDDVDGITPEIEDQVKKGTEYLDEIGNIVENMKEKDSDRHTSESQSDSSTSESTTATCTSSTTYSDCTWDTVVSQVPHSDTTTISVITSTESCTTRTACEATPTTFETTSTLKACTRRPRNTSKPSTTATGDGDTATPGAGGSTASTLTAPMTSPRSSTKTTRASDSSATTTTGPKCRMNHIVNQKASEEYCVFDCSDYSGTYVTASSTSGQKDWKLCPYSQPPSDPNLSWKPDNKGSFTTTAEDGIVYSCDDSRYLDNNVGKAKSCVTSMESITQITSIYTAYTASLESEASASRSSVSASKASASSASAASAASASASAAAATPSSYVFISQISNTGLGLDSGGPPGYEVYSSEYYDPYICDLKVIGSDTDFGDSPPDLDIDGGDFKDCKYDSDSDTVECDDFSLPCSDDDDYTEEPSTKNCDSTVVRVCHRDI
ncbi:hypothetical protein N7481_002617 [Penicillium waksmanii]|uniref:uncharacterized protein n=1 Tax=Penicillium waksmanii TaxID=69791 RepID=UPI002547EA9B|nr:uncharacterized protein N7481_002617 [Penicillium waksmanii]KAJ5995640.1 hypothetical protein N7481_002617 [Penicillium waksmanii]